MPTAKFFILIPTYETKKREFLVPARTRIGLKLLSTGRLVYLKKARLKISSKEGPFENQLERRPVRKSP